MKINALKTKSGKPNREAIDLVRSFIVQSKYEMVYVYDDPMILPETQLNWLQDNVYHMEVYQTLKTLLKERIICSPKWEVTLNHPFCGPDVTVAIVDKLDDVLTLYRNTPIQPIYLPRRK